MSDPLNLLREYNIKKCEITEHDGQIIFGECSFPKNVKTNYLKYGQVFPLLFCIVVANEILFFINWN